MNILATILLTALQATASLSPCDLQLKGDLTNVSQVLREQAMAKHYNVVNSENPHAWTVSVQLQSVSSSECSEYPSQRIENGPNGPVVVPMMNQNICSVQVLDSGGDTPTQTYTHVAKRCMKATESEWVTCDQASKVAASKIPSCPSFRPSPVNLSPEFGFAKEIEKYLDTTDDDVTAYPHQTFITLGQDWLKKTSNSESACIYPLWSLWALVCSSDNPDLFDVYEMYQTPEQKKVGSIEIKNSQSGLWFTPVNTGRDYFAVITTQLDSETNIYMWKYSELKTNQILKIHLPYRLGLQYNGLVLSQFRDDWKTYYLNVMDGRFAYDGKLFKTDFDKYQVEFTKSFGRLKAKNKKTDSIIGLGTNSTGETFTYAIDGNTFEEIHQTKSASAVFSIDERLIIPHLTGFDVVNLKTKKVEIQYTQPSGAYIPYPRFISGDLIVFWKWDADSWVSNDLLYGFNLKDGSMVWSGSTIGHLMTSQSRVFGLRDQVLYYHGVRPVSTSSSTVENYAVALDLSTGTKKWSYFLGKQKMVVKGQIEEVSPASFLKIELNNQQLILDLEDGKLISR